VIVAPAINWCVLTLRTTPLSVPGTGVGVGTGVAEGVAVGVGVGVSVDIGVGVVVPVAVAVGVGRDPGVVTAVEAEGATLGSVVGPGTG
jgi:hypothetical protein